MKLYDIDADKFLTLADLKRDFITLSASEPWNYANNFKAQLFVLMMDTINGRNNCDIIGPTPKETDRIIFKLRKEVIS